jgi:hypothetical protein
LATSAPWLSQGLASPSEIRHYPGVFQLKLPFQLELPFEGEAVPGARGGARLAGGAPRAARARRIGRETSRKNLAFEFSRLALEEE